MMTWITVLEIHCAKATIGKYGYYALKNCGELVLLSSTQGIVGGSVCVVSLPLLEMHGYVVDIWEGARSPDSTSMSLSLTRIQTSKN